MWYYRHNGARAPGTTLNDETHGRQSLLSVGLLFSALHNPPDHYNTKVKGRKKWELLNCLCWL